MRFLQGLLKLGSYAISRHGIMRPAGCRNPAMTCRLSITNGARS
jgi:hypothetical protein